MVEFGKSSGSLLLLLGLSEQVFKYHSILFKQLLLVVLGDYCQDLVSAAIILDFWGGWAFIIFICIFIVMIMCFLPDLSVNGVVIIDFIFWSHRNAVRTKRSDSAEQCSQGFFACTRLRHMK